MLKVKEMVREKIYTAICYCSLGPGGIFADGQTLELFLLQALNVLPNEIIPMTAEWYSQVSNRRHVSTIN